MSLQPTIWMWNHPSIFYSSACYHPWVRGSMTRFFPDSFNTLSKSEPPVDGGGAAEKSDCFNCAPKASQSTASALVEFPSAIALSRKASTGSDPAAAARKKFLRLPGNNTADDGHSSSSKDCWNNMDSALLCAFCRSWSLRRLAACLYGFSVRCRCDILAGPIQAIGLDGEVLESDVPVVGVIAVCTILKGAWSPNTNSTWTRRFIDSKTVIKAAPRKDSLVFWTIIGSIKARNAIIVVAPSIGTDEYCVSLIFCFFFVSLPWISAAGK